MVGQRGQFSISFIWNNFPLSCSKRRPELSESFLFLFLLFNHLSIIHLPPFPKSLFHTSVFCYLLFLSLFSSSSSENSLNPSFLLSALYFSLFVSQTLLIFYNLVHLLGLSELYFRLVLHKGSLEECVFDAILARAKGKHAHTFYQLTKTWNKHRFCRSLQYRLSRFHCLTQQTWYTHMLTSSHNSSSHIWHASKHWNYKLAWPKQAPSLMCVCFAQKMLRCICPS